MQILVTGTPGTGKSTLAARLCEALRARGVSCEIVVVNDLIKSQKLYEEYDSHFDTFIVDDRKVRKYLKTKLKGQQTADDRSRFTIYETHTVTTLPREFVDLAIVLTARTDVLYDRLQARGYTSDKIAENVECEIMQVVWEEAVERFGERKVITCSSNVVEDIEDNLETLLDAASVGHSHGDAIGSIEPTPSPH